MAGNRDLFHRYAVGVDAHVRAIAGATAGDQRTHLAVSHRVDATSAADPALLHARHHQRNPDLLAPRPTPQAVSA